MLNGSQDFFKSAVTEETTYFLSKLPIIEVGDIADLIYFSSVKNVAIFINEEVFETSISHLLLKKYETLFSSNFDIYIFFHKDNGFFENIIDISRTSMNSPSELV